MNLTRMFSSLDNSFNFLFYFRLVRRLKVGKEQLPVITTSTEEDDTRGCGAEANHRDCNRNENAASTKSSGSTITVAEARTNFDSTKDLPNFSSALQLTDDVPSVNHPGVLNRPIYPNIPYSPYSSPRTTRRKSPLKESRRVSIDKCGTYQQLNQYKLIDSIGQVRYRFLARPNVI